MTRWVGAVLACSTVLVACGQQPATTRAFGVATTPPSSGLQDYHRTKADGTGPKDDWKGTDGHWKPDDGKRDHRGGGKGWNGGWDGGWGGAGWGGGWGGSSWDCGTWGGDCGGWGAPWGFPYYLPPLYVSASFGDPFAPPPLAAGPWISPFFGYMGYFGI